MSHSLLKHLTRCAFACAFVAYASPAFATRPLEDFVAGARGRSFDARSQLAAVKQKTWEAEAARGRLLPVFSARGTYTRNQYSVEIPAGTLPGQPDTITFQPQNQFDAVLSLDVPVVDLASVARFQQAKHLRKASEIGVEATASELDRAVAHAYYSYLGAEALVEATAKSLDLAEENLAYVTAHADAGVGTDFDLLRASANVERAKQDQAEARFTSIQTARHLETLSGIAVTPPQHYPTDDLHPEKPLSVWLGQRDTPQDRVQDELSRAARAGKRAAAYAYLPTLSVSAQERFTNASGFMDRNSSYALLATLTFRLDYSTHANARAQAAASEVQAIAVERTRRQVEDTIYEAYHLVEASITRSKSARVQADTARRSAELALERYKAGAATQLDVTESQREALSAASARIRADADLNYARLLLRITAGMPATQLTPRPNPETEG